MLEMRKGEGEMLVSAKKRSVPTKILAVLGTVLVWFPILAPVMFSVVAFIITREFRFDYLMPAELFPAILVGGGLLIWAALREGSHQRFIGGSLGIAAVTLVAVQMFAEVTGLASGATEPVGWPWIGVTTLLAIFLLAVVAVGVGGVLLLRKLFKPTRSARSMW